MRPVRAAVFSPSRVLPVGNRYHFFNRTVSSKHMIAHMFDFVKRFSEHLFFFIIVVPYNQKDM